MLCRGSLRLKRGCLDDLEQGGPGPKERALAAPAGHLLEPESLVGGDRLVQMRDDLDEPRAERGLELGQLVHTVCIVAHSSACYADADRCHPRCLRVRDRKSVV